MLLNELITEEFVSQAQRGKFYACASGKGRDCGDTPTSKWKSMAKEFEDSTPEGKKLPYHKKKKNSALNAFKNDDEMKGTFDDDEELSVPEMSDDERRKFSRRDKRLTRHSELTRKHHVYPRKSKNQAINAFRNEKEELMGIYDAEDMSPEDREKEKRKRERKRDLVRGRGDRDNCTNMSVNAIKAPTLAHLLKATAKKKAKNAAPNDEMDGTVSIEFEGESHDETEDISLCDQALEIIDGITGTGKGHRDLRKSDFKEKFSELRDIISQLRDHEKAEQGDEEHEEDSDPFDTDI